MEICPDFYQYGFESVDFDFNNENLRLISYLKHETPYTRIISNRDAHQATLPTLIFFYLLENYPFDDALKWWLSFMIKRRSLLNVNNNFPEFLKSILNNVENYHAHIYYLIISGCLVNRTRRSMPLTSEIKLNLNDNFVAITNCLFAFSGGDTCLNSIIERKVFDDLVKNDSATYTVNELTKKFNVQGESFLYNGT